MAGEESVVIGFLAGSLICAHYSELTNKNNLLTKIFYWVISQALLLIGLISIWFFMPSATFGTFRPVVIVVVGLGALALFLAGIFDYVLQGSLKLFTKAPEFLKKINNLD